MKIKKFSFLPDELWWGGYVDAGHEMPISARDTKRFDMRLNATCNQINPLFLSSKGRYIWSDGYYTISFECGEIVVTFAGELDLYEGGSNLKDSYLRATKRHMTFEGLPLREAFTKPQYNTWIAMTYWPTQEKVLSYARSIVQNGGRGGLFMIDAGWQQDYGMWRFHGGFPDPAAMVRELHDMGFRVMLWLVPYISPDCETFRTLRAGGGLIKDANGKPLLTEWWEGYSAIVDLSSEAGGRWMKETLRDLQMNYGVDGFKLDGGDAQYCPCDMVTAGNLTPNEFSEEWARLGLNYGVAEMRACCKCGGLPLLQRIADRKHSWDDQHGLGGLVAKCLTQSISGYPYLCPDMVGGGDFSDFLGKSSDELDCELFIRYCQASALMPMIQFSYDYWRMLDQNTVEICNRYARLHAEFGEYIYCCAEKTAKTGEPIIRNLAYAFDDRHDVRDCFMLGSDYLVAPVLKRGQRKQTVRLPSGRWQYVPDGKYYEGGQTVTVAAPLDTLPYFKKL